MSYMSSSVILDTVFFNAYTIHEQYICSVFIILNTKIIQYAKGEARD